MQRAPRSAAIIVGWMNRIWRIRAFGVLRVPSFTFAALGIKNNRTQWSWPLAENIFTLLLLLPIHEIIILKKSCSNVITQENTTSVLITMNKTF
jgi:hypothetical protein